MQFSVRIASALICLCLLTLFLQRCASGDQKPRVLIFDKPEFYIHECTPAAVEALQKLCAENGWRADVTDEAEVFNEKDIVQYAAIIFLNTAGDVLNPTQEAVFQRYIQAGGGFVGIHTAIDTEHNWKWYGDLVGGRFDSQSEVQAATLQVRDQENPATRHLGATWKRKDEWFNLTHLASDLHLLLTLDENSYQGGTMGSLHPIAWYHDFDGGRSFFTAMGHTTASYSEPAFLQHLRGGLQYAIGNNHPIQLQALRAAPAAPASTTGFVKTSLVCNLYEPMAMRMFPDGKILFIERRGAVKRFDPATNDTKKVGELAVYIKNHEGLLGMEIDPNWAQNHWIYLLFSPENREQAIYLSRFVYANDSLYYASEQVMLKVPTDHDKNNVHAPGSLKFDAQGYLYVSLGDNSSHDDQGFSSIDERPGKRAYDAQRSASNSMDLRGKILRIKPLPDGSYSCPAGNLYVEKEVTMFMGREVRFDDPLPTPARPPVSIAADYPKLANARPMGHGRPEIYVMGCRNPYRISYDDRRRLLIWGEPGPDANKPDSLMGPEGYDEINIARTAGNYGWPYFTGNNKAYRYHHYETNQSGPYFDPAHPVNNSPNNTGDRNLPPARPPLIWYSFKSSVEFPLVANGTRCAMAGPTYYCDQYPAETRFPDNFDKKVIVYDWMRNWMMAIGIDSLDRLTSMEPLAGSIRMFRPIDMLIDKTGALWVLEYGTEWFGNNPDACLSRIDYRRGNSQAGTNSPPSVQWDFGGKNRSFYQPGELLNYKVLISDPEDGSLEDGRISPDSIAIAIEYRTSAPPPAQLARRYHLPAPANPFARGKTLIDRSDCKACHAIDHQVNGPAFLAIAGRYEKDKDALRMLTQKVIKGGSGNWSDRAMIAHPQPEKDIQEMVRWILSLSDPANRPLSLQGAYMLTPPANTGATSGSAGAYIFHAHYKDHAPAGQMSLSGSQTLLLRLSTQQAELADSCSGDVTTTRRPLNNSVAVLRELRPGSFLAFQQIDLRGITSVSFAIDLATGRYTGGGRLELHLDAPGGRLVGTAAIPAANAAGGLQELVLPVDKMGSSAYDALHDLYFVLVHDPVPGGKPVAAVDWLRFNF